MESKLGYKNCNIKAESELINLKHPHAYISFPVWSGSLS